MRKSTPVLLAKTLGVFLALLPLQGWAEAPAKQRPASWAEKVERPGLANLHRVSETLWRGAQPSVEGMKELQKLGIKTIVNLRHDTDSDDQPLLEKAGLWGKLGYERIRFSPFKPRLSQVVKFLKIVSDPQRQPVFVHCKHGADRTGMMVAFYRIAVQGWSKQEALEEMTEGGFGFHSIWQNMLKFVHRADIEAIRKEAGLTSAASHTSNP